MILSSSSYSCSCSLFCCSAGFRYCTRSLFLCPCRERARARVQSLPFNDFLPVMLKSLLNDPAHSALCLSLSLALCTRTTPAAAEAFSMTRFPFVAPSVCIFRRDPCALLPPPPPHRVYIHTYGLKREKEREMQGEKRIIACERLG